jgi:hypothetical protein
MLIGGAGLSLLGMATLMVEGGRQTEKADDGSRAARLMAVIYKTRFAGVAGGLLIGLSTFQAEFDFGVPQFRLLFEPVMLAFAAGGALVAARIYAGRGAALIAWLYFLVIRGALALIVGPVLGEPTPYFPLYLVEALIVEAVALAIAPRTRPLVFGAASGLLIATVGFAAEYAWSHVFMPVEWPEILISEALVVVPLVGVAGGIIGGFIGACLAAPRDPGAVRVPGLVVPGLAVVAIAAVIGYGLQVDHQQGVRAAVTLDEVRSGPERTVDATVRFDPATAPEDADWVRGIAWQGGGLVDASMEEVEPGVWRTTEPLPVYGNWKALIRFHEGSSILGLPVYLPEDPAIPAEGVAAPGSFQRSFVPEKQILQRELKDDVPTTLPPIAYSIVAVIFLGLIMLLGWAMARVARGGPPDEGTDAERTTRRTGAAAAAGGRA